MMEGLEAVGETAGAAAVEMAVAAILERGGRIGPCTNCSAPMMGAYCGICGQPVETHRRSVFNLVHDFFKDLLSFDSRILRTVRALMFQPGELSLAFREGRTQRYVPAVRLYFFVSLIFFLVLSAAGIAILQLQLVDQAQKITVNKHGGVSIITSNGISELDSEFKVDKKGNVYVEDDNGKRELIQDMQANGQFHRSLMPVPHFFEPESAYRGKMSADAREILNRTEHRLDVTTKKNAQASWLTTQTFQTLNALANDPAAINGPLTTWIPRVLFVLLPIFALFLAVFYWRQRDFYFVDHLVFSLNIHTFVFAFILLMVGMARLIPGSTVGWIALIGIAAYILFAMKRFYRQNWLWTGTKFASIALLYPSIVLGPAFAGIVLLAVLRV